MLHFVEKYIERQELFAPHDKLIIGVSGGADSVAMLHVLLTLGYDCEVAHCNFHLRDAESDRDEKFVEELAQKLNIPFHKTDFDTKTFAKENSVSIEMAARELRYDWFEELRKKCNAQYIVVAHSADDVVETTLMNFTRGTGIDGLRSIEPKNAAVVRPFLEVWRTKIEQYLQENNLPFVEDSTNAEKIHLRNKFRHSVIPLLETINPAFKKSTLRTVSHLKDVAKIYHKTVKKEQKKFIFKRKSGFEISIPELKKRTGYASLLYEFLKVKDFNSAQVEDIVSGLDGESGQQYFSKTHRVLKDRDSLFVCLSGLDPQPPAMQFTIIEKPDSLTTLSDFKDKNTAYLDANKLQFPLEIRRWQEGDYFYPFGMRKRKKLSNYFIDKKYSLFEKENAWLLLSGGKIVWLVSERTSEHYKIDEKTKDILKIKRIFKD